MNYYSVLSAGYDGNDNEDEARSKYRITFDEPPIVNPDEVMAGMHTPPSVLTIDHSSGIYKRLVLYFRLVLK